MGKPGSGDCHRRRRAALPIIFFVSVVDVTPPCPNILATMLTRHPSLTEAYSPDADRAGQDASAHYEWLVHFLARIIVFLLEHGLATWHPRTPGAPSWVHDRPDLPPGSAQAEAAAMRGTFGRAIEWMCRRRGINPGHPDWPELARAIVAYGGTVQGFRPGLPALGLQWWENPNIVPDMIGMPAATPAADAMALLLSRKNDFAAPPPALHAAPAAAEPAVAPAPARPVLVRAGTGPPTGPPPDPHRQLCYAVSTGPRHGRPRHSDSRRRHAVAARLGTRSNPAFSCPPVRRVAA